MTDGRVPMRVSRKDWASGDEAWRGHVEGAELGTDVTVLFYQTDTPGKGPAWHVHPPL
jgi:hypothetical protein